MTTSADLNAAFEIPGALQFDEPYPGMLRARVTTAVCTGELYLHGAHITEWTPAASEPVLFLSPRSLYTPEKAIRGGIPVIFPWFGARTPEITGNRTGGTQHGFARTAQWTLAFAAAAGDEVRLVLTLGPDDATRAQGFDAFRCALEVSFGHTLTVRLTVANESETHMVFEQALHTYFHVADVRAIKVGGLLGTQFLDKTDSFARKTQEVEPLSFAEETDRAYLNTATTVTIGDSGLTRRIVVDKSGSNSTVVWNPWETLAATLADLGTENWPRFVCVETANAAENRITLQPRDAHVMELIVRAEPLR